MISIQKEVQYIESKSEKKGKIVFLQIRRNKGMRYATLYVQALRSALS